MFYNSDVLSQRKGGLGVIWLAATIGNKSNFRKLSKREIVSIDVSKACERVASPPEPMALRLSSQLMYGVVRVYVQQADIWMGEVANVSMMIRKLISDIRVATNAGYGTRGIDMQTKSVRPDAITIPVNDLPFVGDFDYDVAWDLAEDQFGEGMSSSGLASNFKASTPKMDRNTADRSKITLPSPIYDEEEPLGEGRGDAMDAMPVDGDFTTGLDLGLDIGLEGDEAPGAGAMEVTFGDGAAPPLTSSSDFGGRAGLSAPGLSSSSDHAGALGRAEGLDSVMNDAPDLMGGDTVPEGFELGRSPEGQAGPEKGADGTLLHGNYFDPSQFRQEGGAQPPETPLRSALKRRSAEAADETGADGEMTLDQDNQAAPAPLTKKKKVVKFKEDAALELTDEEMRAAKRDYVSEMARQKEQQRLLEKQRTDVALAQQMIFGTPKDMFDAPLLVEFWNVTVDARIKEIQDRVTNKKHGRDGRPVGGRDTSPKAGVAEFGEEHGDMPNDGLLPDLKDDYPHFDDEPGIGLGLGIDGGASSSMNGSNEIGRAASSMSIGHRASLPWNDFAQKQHLDMELTGTVDGGSQAGTLRSFSVATPIGLKTRGRASSVASSPRLGGHESVARESIGHGSLTAGDGQFEGFDLGDGPGLDDRTGPSRISESQAIQSDLEQESRNFLDFAKNVQQELKDQPLFFSDLAPIADSMPTVAAQAFYHVLALANTRRMRVHQQDAFGEIAIDIAG